MNSIQVRSSAGRKAAAARKQMLLSQPCRGCGGKRDTTQPRCEKCRAEENRSKKNRAVRSDIEKLIANAGITARWFEDAPAQKIRRKQAA